MATPARNVRIIILALALSFGPTAFGLAGIATAQSAENVAVVINDNSPASRQIGDYYVQKRGIPSANVFHVKTAPAESIDRAIFVATIQQPLALALTQRGLQDRILYIVLTKGVPLRISGTAGRNTTIASVDSELTLLYRELTGQPIELAGPLENPYFLGVKGIADAHQFSHREHDIYLVTRLDAFSVDDALALVDRGLRPVTEGKIVLDQQNKLVNRSPEDWLANAAAQLKSAGQGGRVMLDTAIQPVRGVTDVLGYYSWGSNDPRNQVRKFGIGFVPGALAAMFVSTDARTFNEPPTGWTPGDTSDTAKWYAGSPQSLSGDLIREGATGVAGYVSEPYQESLIRPDILFPAYLAGFDLVESFYLAMPNVSWQTVVVGDPLCAPFRRRVLSRADIEDGLDPTTTLPAGFSKRRLAVAAAQLKGIPENAVAQSVRGETLFAKGDVGGAKAALDRATADAPQFGAAHLRLAVLLDGTGDREAAVKRYQEVLRLEPNHLVALNNVAYDLAVYRHAPAEALPFARRALAIAPRNAAVLDTVGWIEHLTGDNENALKRLQVAVKAVPTNPEFKLHAAAVYLATGARGEAKALVDEALQLNPALASREELKQLRAALDAAR